MKKIAIFAAVLALAATPALAKKMSVPEDNPIATVEIPDDWQPDSIDRGAEGTSPDNTTYIAVEEVDGADAKAATSESIDLFQKDSMKIDESSMKTNDIDFGGKKGVDITVNGTNKDGPQNLEIVLMPTPTDGKFLLLTYWGTPDGAKANKAALDKIQESLSPAG